MNRLVVPDEPVRTYVNHVYTDESFKRPHGRLVFDVGNGLVVGLVLVAMGGVSATLLFGSIVAIRWFWELLVR